MAVGIYLGLNPILGTETTSWLCIVASFPFAAMGFLKYNGMTAEKFIWAWIKSTFLTPRVLTFGNCNYYYKALVEDNAGTLNLGSLDTSETEAEEAADALSEYVVALSISPSISSLTVDEGVGNINAVSGEYQVTSSQLGELTKLHFVVTPDQNITTETTYTVSVNVTGSVTGSDSFIFIVTPVASQEESSSAGDDTSTEESLPSGNDDSKKPSGADMSGNKKQMSGGKSGASGGGSSGSVSSSSSTVTYAGSWDNYLDALSVDGYEFTQKFNKIRNTYFLTVPDSVTSLEVSATPSDSSAIVAIAGNNDLNSARNKIMVDVTADDGSVRVYRIIVDRLSEEELAALEEEESAYEEPWTQGEAPRDGMGEGNGPGKGFEPEGRDDGDQKQ